LQATGATTLGSTLSVTGTSTLANASSTNITASGFLNSATLNVSGAAALASTLSVGATTTLTAGGLLSGVTSAAGAAGFLLGTSNAIDGTDRSVVRFESGGTPFGYIQKASASNSETAGLILKGGAVTSEGTAFGLTMSNRMLALTQRTSGDGWGGNGLTIDTLNGSGALLGVNFGFGTNLLVSFDAASPYGGDTGFIKSTATGGNFSTKYDATEVQRFSSATTGAIGTSLTVGSLADASSTLHVVGTFQTTGAVTLGSTLGVTGVTTLATTTATGITVSTNGLTISSSTPFTTTNTLYNLGGTLKWNGSNVVSSASGTAGYIQLSDGSSGLTANSLFKWDSTNARLGIGTSATPSSTLHVVGDFTVTGTSTLQGPTIIDDLLAGATSFETDAGQVSWIDMPVTASSSNGTVHSYTAQLDGNLAMVIYGTANGSGAIANLGVGFGTSTPGAILHAYASGTTVGMFDRGISDGTVISIRRDNAEQGTISVTAGTVSYNAFTGSHYALLEDASSTVMVGEVMTLTGKNERLHNKPTDEILYGIRKSTIENDPAILGAYLGPQESSKVQSVDNPVLVTAVGNSDLWVVDTGKDLAVGDYLITSNVPGHAMLDPRVATTSYIFARVSEPIAWADVADTVTIGTGEDQVEKKHAKVTVFYESFARDNAAANALALQNTGAVAGGVLGSLSGISSLEIDGPLAVKGPVTFNKDTVGQAEILSGGMTVRINFSNQYPRKPIVTASIVDSLADFRYAIKNADATGFNIDVDRVIGEDVTFNWHAFASSEDAVIFVSDGTTKQVNITIAEPAPLPEIQVPVASSTDPVVTPETVVPTSTEPVVAPEIAAPTSPEPVVVEQPAPESATTTEQAVAPTSTDAVVTVSPTSTPAENVTPVPTEAPVSTEPAPVVEEPVVVEPVAVEVVVPTEVITNP
jgi:hypothetical protein